jgi:hypothetical protein
MGFLNDLYLDRLVNDFSRIAATRATNRAREVA